MRRQNSGDPGLLKGLGDQARVPPPRKTCPRKGRQRPGTTGPRVGEMGSRWGSNRRGQKRLPGPARGGGLEVQKRERGIPGPAEGGLPRGPAEEGEGGVAVPSTREASGPCHARPPRAAPHSPGEPGSRRAPTEPSRRSRMSAVSRMRRRPPGAPRSPRQHWKHTAHACSSLMGCSYAFSTSSRDSSKGSCGSTPPARSASPVGLPARAMAAPLSPPARRAGFHNSRSRVGRRSPVDARGADPAPPAGALSSPAPPRERPQVLW